MHKLTMYETILDMLEREIGDIEKSGLKTKEDVCNLHYLLASVNHTVDHIDYLKMKKAIEEDIDQNQQMSNMNSNGGGNSNNYSYGPKIRMSYDGNSNDFNSYGRYPYSRYSRDEGKRKMVTKLHTLMDDTMSDQERQAIQDCIERIERDRY